MWIISDEDKTVASTWGATIHLKAGEARQVGHDLGLLCLQAGCTEVKDVKEEVSVVEDSPKIDEGSGGAEVEIPTEETTTPDLNSMTKVQLEEYGRTVGVELDRRKKKETLIEELQSHS